MQEQAHIIAPRHLTPGAGTPHDRRARLAARQAFVSLKLTFLEALDGAPDSDSDWLRAQVRGAEEPVDLWLLRAPVFALLADADCRARRQLLRRGLDSMFPDLDGSAGQSSFMPF